jgi:hypothetical protein
VTPVEVEAVLCPLAVDDLDLLGEHLHPDAHLGEREAVGEVLSLHPATADAELDSTARHVVRRHGRLPEH